MSYVNYPVGDFLIQIKNAAMAKNRTIAVRNTKQIKALAGTLKQAGFLEKVEEKEGVLDITLSFHKKEPVLMDLQLVSTPGLRVYMSADDLIAHKGPEILIVSTSKGVVTAKKAIKDRVGGEVIAKIY